ncbi:MAG: glycoside hydrolase family 2 [Clostridia bacterium]|nr:glycoside hydrolase family 2 [Clostridia bacterium]
MKKSKFHKLYTKEGRELCDIPWNEYPRPQMKRKSFFSLNGEWDFYANGGSKETILVPYPPESILSGIGRDMGKYPYLRYRKIFSLPKDFKKDRVILHFGAVDQISKIKLNNVVIGVHRGGYDPFSFDITDKLLDKNILEVEVTDELENGVLPYGKQRRKRGGMWYTPISGIWQTVWIESVPEHYIKNLRIEINNDGADIIADANDGVVVLKALHEVTEHEFKDGRAHVVLNTPKYWTPEAPHLYHFELRTKNDAVESYFALRKIEIRNINGHDRVFLNGEPYFFNGVLDQGYYSDGIFLPASPENFRRDIETMKSMGFNTLRKHIKIEPEIFYYECDRLGMIVFQDMVNNGSYSFARDTLLPTIGMKKLPNGFRGKNERAENEFLKSMKNTVSQLYNHPCVCYWTIFNEGWGQFNANQMYDELKAIDSTRIIDTTSGWFKKGNSDVESLHVYFKSVKIKKTGKPIFLTEFGGYSFKVKDHCFNEKDTYGYKKFIDKESYENAVYELYEKQIIPNIANGLCGAILTQLSDVEDETNGILTFDRNVIKLDKGKMCEIAEKLKI